MDKITNLASKGIQLVLIAIGVILFFMIWNGEESVPDGPDKHADGAIGAYLIFGKWLIYGCAFAIIIFAVLYIAMNIKQSIPMLIGLALFGVIMLIGYSMASGELLDMWISNEPDAVNPTEAVSKWAGAGLMTTYILGIIAIIAVIADRVISIFKSIG